MGTMMIILDLEYEIEKLGDLVDIQRPKRETHETEVPRKKKSATTLFIGLMTD